MPASSLRRLSQAALLGLAAAGCDRSHILSGPQCAVVGLDVSHHQDRIDWPHVTGARFLWIKATEGGDYLDPSFRRNWLLSRAAGFERGAYHFVTWCRRAEDQAAWFIANVPADPDALPPVLDVEWNPNSRTCPQKIPRDEALGIMKVILAAMEKTYARKPVIYAPLDFYQDVMVGTLEDYPLWVRNIDNEPAAGYGGRHWLVWQRKDGGRVEGVVAPVDIDCFNGDVNDWRSWVASGP